MENPFKIADSINLEYAGEGTFIIRALWIDIFPVLHIKALVVVDEYISRQLLNAVRDIIENSILSDNPELTPFIILESKGSDSNVVYRLESIQNANDLKNLKQELYEFWKSFKENFGGQILSVNSGFDRAHELKSKMIAKDLIVNFNNLEEAFTYILNFESPSSLKNP